MQAKVKSNSVVTTVMKSRDGAIVTEMGDAVILEFNVKGAGTVKLSIDSIAPVNLARAGMYGLNVRCTRAAALPVDTTTGKSASPADKLAAIKELVDHLASGSEDWSPKRAGRGPSGPKFDAIILRALCEFTGKDEAGATESVTKGAAAKGIDPKDYLIALGTGKALAPIVERMRAEAATKVEVDADEELEGMMGE